MLCAFVRVAGSDILYRVGMNQKRVDFYIFTEVSAWLRSYSCWVNFSCDFLQFHSQFHVLNKRWQSLLPIPPVHAASLTRVRWGAILWKTLSISLQFLCESCLREGANSHSCQPNSVQHSQCHLIPKGHLSLCHIVCQCSD